MNVKIGNVTYRIVEEKEVVYKGNSTYFGLTEYDKQQIQIKSGLYPDQKKKTLIHELTHAFAFEMGFNDPLNRQKFNHEMLADFIGAYAESIVKIADEYIEYRKKVREETLADILNKKADKS